MSERRTPFILYLLGAIAVVVAAAGVFLLATGKSQKAHADGEARLKTLAAGPRVRVIQAAQSPATRNLVLQAEARPFASVTLFAKLSGYLRKVNVDKGDKVRANQLLATIESPEVDRQYDAALADLKNKRVNAKRAAALAPSGVVSAAEADLARTQAEVAAAQVATLATQKRYEAIRAPFAGTVTARYADAGALLQNAANSQTSALPLVTVSQTARLRVYAWLDQRDAPFVKPGDAADVRLSERPGLVVAGKVTRSSTELDPRTRMMLVEIDLDNRKGTIVSGSFVQVSLRIAVPSLVEVPVEALVLRGRKPFVAVVEQDDTVHYKAVVVADDDGQKARILDGLKAGEQVALNLGDSVPEGQKVQPVLPQAPRPPK